MNSVSWGVTWCKEVLQEREWGKSAWSRPRSWLSLWDGRQVWGLDFVQEGTQEVTAVKSKKVRGGSTPHRHNVGHLGRQESQGTGLPVLDGPGNSTGWVEEYSSYSGERVGIPRNWVTAHLLTFTASLGALMASVSVLSDSLTCYNGSFPGAQTVKRLPAVRGTWVPSLGQEDPLEKEMATHSSVLAWKITWREEPGGLQSMGWQRVGWLSDFTFLSFYNRRTSVILDLRGSHQFLSFCPLPVSEGCPIILTSLPTFRRKGLSRVCTAQHWGTLEAVLKFCPPEIRHI